MSDLGSKADINDIYTERNLAVALACEMARRLGYHTEVYCGERVAGQEPEWIVVFIELPTGQVSWHIPTQEYVDFFPALISNLSNSWDGHTTEEKNERIARFTNPKGETSTSRVGESSFGQTLVETIRQVVREEMTHQATTREDEAYKRFVERVTREHWRYRRQFGKLY